MFWGFTLGANSISEEVAGFSPFMVSPEKHCVHCLLCLIVVLVILSVKYPNNASLMLKNYHGIRANLRRRHCAATGTRDS